MAALSPKHGPENADHELRKAYDATIESAMMFFWDRKAIAGVNPDEVLTLYKHAFACHRKGRKLAAERWARTAKHLARAFYHEAKIAYLEPRIAELPHLLTSSATPSATSSATSSAVSSGISSAISLEDAPRNPSPPPLISSRRISHSDTTADLLDSVAEDLPPGFSEMPEDMRRYLARGRKHLDLARSPLNELIIFERIQAAHEYGRVIECLALAHEAERPNPKAA